MPTISDFQAQRIDGSHMSLAELQGRVLLIVNTASACGFTPQLAGLESLHQTLGPKGLTVMGFPCNQFGGQDPGSNEEIGAFCQKNYGVSFPMMAKIEVNGAQAHPLFQWLKAQAPGILAAKASSGTSPNSWSAKTARCWAAMRPPTPPPRSAKTSKQHWPPDRRVGFCLRAPAALRHSVFFEVTVSLTVLF